MAADAVAPTWFAVIPLAGLVLLVVGTATLARRRAVGAGGAGVAEWARVGVCAAACSAASVLCLAGLYEGDALALVLLAVSAVGAGTLACARRPLAERISRLAGRRRLAAIACRDLAVIASCTLACLLALELPWNETFPALLPGCLNIELSLICGLLVALYFLAQRRGGGLALACGLMLFVGLAQYFVIKFKASAILPSDLFALGTAAAVADGYTYAVGSRVMWGVGAALVGIGASALLGPAPETQRSFGRHAQPPARRPPAALLRALGAGANLACGLAAAGALAWFVTNVNFQHDLDVKFYYWSTANRYSEDGFLTAFVAAAQDLPIRVPPDYSDERAEAEEEALAQAYDAQAADDEARALATAQFDETRPSVVVVMNETFADLSSFEVLRDVGYEGPRRFQGISDALVRGRLAVSVNGGGTCNTEFELLTGNPYAFVGSGKYPYVMYDLSEAASLARQLSALGYTCSALHPNDAQNWNRDKVYEALGFDRFYSISDFAGAEELHSGVSDAATYDKVLSLLEGSDEPQFVFDVTMQNHSGYDQHNMPSELLAHYGLNRYADDQWTSDAIDEYLACIEASDQALADFMERLSALERPVVLVFFGDHQPHFSVWINDDLYEREDELTHALRAYQTDYVVWANYDVAGRAQQSSVEDASAEELGAMTLELVGAPLTRLERARLAARGDIRALNVFGYEGADLSWYAADDEDSPYRKTYEELWRVCYRNFGATA